MSIVLNDKYVKDFVREHELSQMQSAVREADRLLRTKTGAGNDFLGWVTLPLDYDKEEYVRIKASAEKIRKNCDVFIVIGIGGSYLGARAAIEYLKGTRFNALRNGAPLIYFSGNGISATQIDELLQICEGKDVCINVISKSGTTTEPAIAFRVFRDLLEKKYGEEGARERIFVTTDKAKGTLRQLANEKGYESFVTPDDVGGRFSVLTAVGLLPIAVAGIDIDQLMKGAGDAVKKYSDPSIEKNDAYRYAAIRQILSRKGFEIEEMVNYEAYATLFNEWWKQLYGESEGKDGKGIYPASVVFSTDLHSLGQFIQDGKNIIFETVVYVNNNPVSFKVPVDASNGDGLNFLAGRELDDVKKTAMQATILAHVDGGVPNLLLEVSDRSAYALGELLYFFEIAVAISGYLSGVNPFDQPGVESYKKNMFALLGKPGYEDKKAELEKRIAE